MFKSIYKDNDNSKTMEKFQENIEIKLKKIINLIEEIIIYLETESSLTGKVK